MSDKQEGILSAIAAALVIFSAMLNPLVTVVLSASLMVAFAVYKLVKTKKETKEPE